MTKPDTSKLKTTLITQKLETDFKPGRNDETYGDLIRIEIPDDTDETGTTDTSHIPNTTEQQAEETPTLEEVIKEQAIEGEAPHSSDFKLTKILGGDILYTATIRRQIWLMLLITLFTIIYISNRYSCQKYLIEIDKLNTELKNAKYKTLSTESKLTEKSRQSHVLEVINANENNKIKAADQPPFIINVPEE